MSTKRDSPVPADDKVLEGGAALLQRFEPLKGVCAHLNAFHVYASQPERFVETNHYCAHISSSVRQCLLYDSAASDARLLGIEYMITPEIYETLSSEERSLWHSHVFEVKSGMLVMPGPAPAEAGVPGMAGAWETAETKEMEKVIELYGKVYHLWDERDELPLGQPRLMTSFTDASQLPAGFETAMEDRDRRYGTDWKRRKELRGYIKEPNIHKDADVAWKRRASF